MLTEMWKLVKASFNKRLLLYFTVVTCFTMFGSIPIALFKFAFLLAFFPLAILFLIIVSKNFIYPNFKFVFLSRKGQKVPIPTQLQELAKKMGIPLKEMKIIECDSKNAFTTRNGIAFTKKLMDELNEDEIVGVAAHELGHKKGRHGFFRFLVTIPIMLLIVLCWSRFTAPIVFNEAFTQILFQLMMNLALLAFTIVALIPVSWVMELKADEMAARFTGKEGIRSALIKLSNPENAKQPSESHPSIADRVKRIDDLKF